MTTIDLLSPVHTGDNVEFNTVDFGESRLLPKPAIKSTRLLSYTFNFVADTADFVASVYGAKSDTVDFVDFQQSRPC